MQRRVSSADPFWARMLNVVMQACRDDWHARANAFQFRRGMQRPRANADGAREIMFDQGVRLAATLDLDIGLQSHGNHAKMVHFAGPFWGPENGPQNVPAYLQSNKAAPKTVPFSGPQNGTAKLHIFGFFFAAFGGLHGDRGYTQICPAHTHAPTTPDTRQPPAHI